MKAILTQIECDLENIQEMVNMLPFAESKGDYRSIVATIKVLKKEIWNQKCSCEDKLFQSKEKVKIPLFECEPSPLCLLEEYKNMDSFFGDI